MCFNTRHLFKLSISCRYKFITRTEITAKIRFIFKNFQFIAYFTYNSGDLYLLDNF